MRPADMVGGVSVARTANLKTSGEALPVLMKQVDARTVSRALLSSGSGPFPEAHFLYEQYHAVHDKLASFSRTPHLQTETTGVAAQGAHRGFGNLEEEQRRRFREVRAEIRALRPDGERTGDGRS